ncbi:FlgD immunoglobulin-like domain containing protein [Candidatus Zixiibacteriota bacterium]
MTVAKSIYQGAIPQQTTANTLVEYYVYAEDGAVPANSQTDPIGAPSAVFSFTAGVTGVEDQEPFRGVPKRFALYQNYPDPFNAGTEILYALPRACHAHLEIYNVLGQRVRVLTDEFRTAGYHTVHWDGRDENGRPAASGIYLYRLQAGEYANTRKMVLLK